MTEPRKYKKPLTAVQKMRMMRVIIVVRWILLRAALEEEKLDIAHSPQGQATFVHRHRRLQKYLAGHFPFIDIRNDSYVSDLVDELAKDIIHYVLKGDTPGGP